MLLLRVFVIVLMSLKVANEANECSAKAVADKSTSAHHPRRPKTQTLNPEVKPYLDPCSLNPGPNVSGGV